MMQGVAMKCSCFAFLPPPNRSFACEEVAKVAVKKETSQDVKRGSERPALRFTVTPQPLQCRGTYRLASSIADNLAESIEVARSVRLTPK